MIAVHPNLQDVKTALPWPELLQRLLGGLAPALVVLALSAGPVDAGQPTGASPEGVAAALVARVLPGRSGEFAFESLPPDQGRDVFEVESRGGKVVLRGNNGIAFASALNHYLKYVCHCDISWCGDQLNLPASLPAVPEKMRIVNPHKWRVYFNYCTLSYTGAWWDWPRWEREIDFMALNGINLPLAPTGLEAVWYHTLLQFKFTDGEAREFLAGPAFFAWQWMQNLEGHGGPLPKSWIDSHAELARRILQRERELGMTPIQQGFSGHVPRLMKQKFPAAAMKQQPSWCGFPGVMQLDPLDPLFAKFGRAFLEEEIKLYGTSHVYAADPFHESSPPKPGAEYLRQVGAGISKLFTDVDPQALWAMQAWSIRQEIATAVPKDRLLVLDLGGGRRDFWGYDFIVGQLHNFGGRINLHGDLADVAGNKFTAAKHATTNAVGMGAFMEGTTQNPVFYNLVFDMMWRDGPADVRDWVHQYVRRRYGAESATAAQAWDILLQTAYKRGTSGVENSSIVAARPALDCKKSGPNAGFDIPYPPARLARAWDLLLQDRNRLKTSDGYQFDVADVARQVLSNLGQAMQKEAARGFKAGDRAAFASASREFLELLTDVDLICATRSEYNFGKWVSDARRWGATDAERALYEYNASMLVTLWGPEDGKGAQQIFDYSWREWGGLIRSYYLPRWEMFFRYLNEHPDYKEAGLSQVHGREAFRANDFYRGLADWEIAWTRQHHDLPAEPVGDPVALSAQLLRKYQPLLDRYYPPPPPQGLEQNAKATASAVQGDCTPDKAIDGRIDLGSYWGADPAPQWLQLDLQNPHRIGGIHVWPYWGDGRYYQYKIEVSTDAQRWSLVADMSQNTNPATERGDLHKVPATDARYVRVTMLKNSANPGVHIVELKVYP
jgi:alpha-N-acetylglucosaminidase